MLVANGKTLLKWQQRIRQSKVWDWWKSGESSSWWIMQCTGVVASIARITLFAVEPQSLKRLSNFRGSVHCINCSMVVRGPIKLGKMLSWLKPGSFSVIIGNCQSIMSLSGVGWLDCCTVRDWWGEHPYKGLFKWKHCADPVVKDCLPHN